VLWLVPEEQRKLAADRYYTGYKPHIIQPIEAAILHYTGSVSFSGTRKWLTDEDDTFLSVHFLIPRDGEVWQHIPLNERGAHAGGATSRLFGKGNVNGRTVGIELMNVGPVVEQGGELQTLSKRPFKFSATCAGGDRPTGGKYPYESWEAYPPAQLSSLVGLLKQLVLEFPILAEDPFSRVTGHENVDPTRKLDPGPAFPWELVRGEVFGHGETGDLEV
jgi:N-acetyl-anhydromuramyl-L-alanine amidase AmpD